MWKEFIGNLLEESEFVSAVQEEEIHQAEHDLDIRFPNELRELLMETNGALGRYKMDLVWSLDRIRKDNLLFRNHQDFKDLYMPFDCLLFFADAGNGDQFAYSILNGKIQRNDIFVWNHENDSRTWVASNLKQYLDWLINGVIEI